MSVFNDVACIGRPTHLLVASRDGQGSYCELCGLTDRDRGSKAARRRSSRARKRARALLAGVHLPYGPATPTRYAHLHPKLRRLLIRDGETCAYCGREVELIGRSHELAATRDHVIPLSRGGADDDENCVVSCSRCNHEKDDMTPEEWVKRWYTTEAKRRGTLPRSRRMTEDDAMDPFKGAMIGALVGDALGAPYEGIRDHTGLGELDEVKFGRGRYGHAPGAGTDDTAVAHNLARALVECEGELDAATVLDGLYAWVKSGPLDVGGQTMRAAYAWSRGERLETDHTAAGNGAAMAAWVCGLARYGRPAEAGDLGMAYSTLTHPSRDSLNACRAIASVVAAGADGEVLTQVRASIETLRGDWQPSGPRGIGWAVGTAWVAMRAVDLTRHETPLDALRWVVRQGGDTDTNASVAGALLGARYGDHVWDEVLGELDTVDLAHAVELSGQLAVVAGFEVTS